MVEVNDRLIAEAKDISCILCSTGITTCHGMPTNLQDAVEIEISGHYGSAHDGLRILAALCDKCTLQVLSQPTINNYNCITREVEN